MLNLLEEAEQDPAVKALIKDPYGLNPADAPRGLDGPEKTYPEYDPDFRSWVAPFVMAQINTKVVRRSNALLGFPYGTGFRYDEGMLMPFGQLGFPLAVGLASGVATMNATMRSKSLRGWLAGMLPETGTGPDQAARESGYFQIQLLGRHPNRSSADLRLRIQAAPDPANGATVKCVSGQRRAGFSRWGADPRGRHGGCSHRPSGRAGGSEFHQASSRRFTRPVTDRARAIARRSEKMTPSGSWQWVRVRRIRSNIAL
jgi:short subunit dehydrogenase-like uncharacterized protein